MPPSVFDFFSFGRSRYVSPVFNRLCRWLFLAENGGRRALRTPPGLWFLALPAIMRIHPRQQAGPWRLAAKFRYYFWTHSQSHSPLPKSMHLGLKPVLHLFQETVHLSSISWQEQLPDPFDAILRYGSPAHSRISLSPFFPWAHALPANAKPLTSNATKMIKNALRFIIFSLFSIISLQVFAER